MSKAKKDQQEKGSTDQKLNINGGNIVQEPKKKESTILATLTEEKLEGIKEYNRPLPLEIEEKFEKHHDQLELLDQHLCQIHMHQCASDKHRRCLAPEIPHQEIYAAVSTPDDLTSEQQKEFCEAELEQRGATPEKWKEYCDACDKRNEACLDRESQHAFFIAESIRKVITSSTCLYCGESHVDEADEGDFRYDWVMRSLFVMAARELLSRELWNKPVELMNEVNEIALELKKEEAA